MAMTPRRQALVAVAFGALFVVAGVALIYPPAALILTGLAIAAGGLFAIEVDEK